MEGVRRLGPHRHPTVTLTGRAMHFAMDDWEQGRLADLRTTFAREVERLAATGADFFICPDNTAHIALESAGSPLVLPRLHIADVVAGRAIQEGRRRIGILGTRWTMTGPVYPRALGYRGLQWALPDEEDQALVHSVIFEEMCLGRFLESSCDRFIEIIRRLATGGCDAVALVCTEIPLLVTADVSPLPLLDSTRLLAHAAIEVAVGERPMPAWRGGPPDAGPLTMPRST
jgi:aspartate racemase